MDIGGIIDKAPDVMNMAMAPIMGIGQWMQDERAYAENMKRYGQGMDIFKGLIDSGGQNVGDAWSRYDADTAKLGSDANRMWSDHAQQILGQAQGRYKRGMNYLKGAGDQERRDINTGFDSQTANIKQDMASRGLGSSTISSGVQQGSERQRADAIGGLNERLRRQYAETDARLSGDVMNIHSALGQKGYDDNIARAYGRLGTRMQSKLAPHEYAANSWKDLARWIGDREDIYPSETNFLNIQAMQGQASAPAYEAPKAEFDWFTPAAGAASAAVTTKIMMACIGGECLVETCDGLVRLANVCKGDMIRCDEGGFREIAAKDFGESHSERVDDFLKIITSRGWIVLTRDHKICGKAASEWKVGDVMECNSLPCDVIRVGRHPSVPSGDISLVGGGEYLANGFPISSMIDEYGLLPELENVHVN